MLNSTEQEIPYAHENWKMKIYISFKLSDDVFIMLINVKMPAVGILSFISTIHFVLSWVEHGKSFINSGPGFSRRGSVTILTQKNPLIYKG